jgi:hypothetical protein
LRSRTLLRCNYAEAWPVTSRFGITGAFRQLALWRASRSWSRRSFAIISFIRHRFMDTPFLAAAFQVVVEGVLVFMAGIAIGSS